MTPTHLLEDKIEKALEECAREPIHIPGSIQPIGFLIQYDYQKDEILTISNNLLEYLSLEQSTVLGQSLNSILGKVDAIKLRDTLKDLSIRGRVHLGYSNQYRINLLRGSEENFLVSAHEQDDLLMLEFEKLSIDNPFIFFDFNANLQDTLYWMFSPSNLTGSGVFDMCVQELMTLTGFGRVTMYRFDEEYNGEVIAEALNGMESFLGLHFPASDIPVQARKMFLRNWVRAIPNIDHQPVPLVSKRDNQQYPVDLSGSAFRAVSPVHLQYLENMGVKATLTVSVVVDGRLWGLLACHHSEPLYISPDRRAAAVYLGQLLSLFISKAEREKTKERRASLQSLENSVLSGVYRHSKNLYDVLGQSKKEISDLCQADGLVVVSNQTIRVRYDVSVNEEYVPEFLFWLEGLIDENIYYHTDKLPGDSIVSQLLGASYSGIMVFSMLGSHSSFLVWFKKERVKKVRWAGAPQKEIELTKEGKYRLNPRSSFEEWSDKVKGRATPWSEEDVSLAHDLSKFLALQQVKQVENIFELNQKLKLVKTQNEYKLREASQKEKILNERFKTVIESSPDALAAIDSENRFFILNKNYQRLFEDRYGKVPKVGNSLAELLKESPEELKSVLKFWETDRFNKQENYEFTYTNAQGKLMYMTSSYSIIRDPHKKRQGVLVTIRDVTRAKEAEKSAHNLLQKYELLVKAVSPLAWTTDPEGKFVTAQPAWGDYTGQSFEEYIDTGWLNAIHPEERDELLEHWNHCLQKKLNYEITCQVWNTKTQKYHYNMIHAIPIFGDDGQVSEWFGSCIDIQVLKDQEAKLENALTALKASNHDLQHFAYVASHDLQEPLRMISSYLGLIDKRYTDKLDDKGRVFIHYAVDGAARMKKLIQDLLTYSQVSNAAKYEKVDLNELLTQVKNNFSLVIKEKNVTLKADELPTLEGTPVQLLQLFSNLIGNSIKFSSTDRPPVIKISCVERLRYWQFFYEDNGIGVDPKYVEKVFNIFFRLQSKEKYPGTGMGLAICQRVVANHSGKIWIDSEYGDGTRFIFTLKKTQLK